MKNRYRNSKWLTIFLAILLLLKKIIWQPARTGNPDSGRWAAKLLQLGRGNIPTNAYDEIDLTTLGGNIASIAQELQSKIYPNLEENYKKSEWLQDRTILAPRNDIVEQINASLMAKMPGESVA